MESWQITEVSELEALAEALLTTFNEADQNQAVVLGLTGPLGAGKTTFVQALARQLGVLERVTSPTFVIMKSYELKHPTFDRLVHIDAYRIETETEMLVLGWQELLATPRTLVCIEWPEKISALLPHDYYQLTFTLEGENRLVTFHYG